MTLPEAFQQGREAFDQGHFFAAHEHWERAWRAAPLEERPRYRALIQLAAGCLKIEQQAYTPARRLLDQAFEGFQGAGAVPEIDLPALREKVQALRQQLEVLGPERMAEFDPGWYPTIVPR